MRTTTSRRKWTRGIEEALIEAGGSDDDEPEEGVQADIKLGAWYQELMTRGALPVPEKLPEGVEGGR